MRIEAGAEGLVLRGALGEPDERARAGARRLRELLERALPRLGVDLREAPVDRLDRARVVLLEEPVREDRRRFGRLLLHDDFQRALADRAVLEARQEGERAGEHVLLDGARERDARELLDEDGDLERQRRVPVLELLRVLRERLRHRGRERRRPLLVLAEEVEPVLQGRLLEAREEGGVRGVRRAGPLDRRGLAAAVHDDLRDSSGRRPTTTSTRPR